MRHFVSVRPCCCLIALVCAGAAEAQIIFSKIADTTTPAPGSATTFSSFRFASISGDTMAFTAVPGSAAQSVFTGSVGSVGANLIAQPGTSAGADGVFQFSLGPVSAISGSNIVFFGTTSAGGQGIYAGIVGSTGASSVANNLTPSPANPSQHLSNFQGGPCVSGNNVVFACNGPTVSGIFTRTIGSSSLSVIADPNTPVPGQSVNFNSNFGGSPSISGNKVAFEGNWSSGSGVYTGTAGVTGASLIVDTMMQAPGAAANFSFFGIAMLSGTHLAYSARFSGGEGVYMSTFGSPGATRIVDNSMLIPGTSTAFGGFLNIAIGGDNVAFQENHGIFFADDGIISRVIGIGDPLFGSTVTSAHLGQDGYDDTTKQVAFDYVLASGERGVATAYVGLIPEPAMLCVPLIAHFLLRRRSAAPSRITPRA